MELQYAAAIDFFMGNCEVMWWEGGGIQSRRCKLSNGDPVLERSAKYCGHEGRIRVGIITVE